MELACNKRNNSLRSKITFEYYLKVRELNNIKYHNSFV